MSARVTAFSLFMKEHRPIIQAEQPNLMFSEMAKALTDRYEKLSADEKQRYESMVENENERKRQEKAEKKSGKKLKEEHPNLMRNQMEKILAQRYVTLSADERKKYELMEEEDTKEKNEKFEALRQQAENYFNGQQKQDDNNDDNDNDNKDDDDEKNNEGRKRRRSGRRGKASDSSIVGTQTGISDAAKAAFIKQILPMIALSNPRLSMEELLKDIEGRWNSSGEQFKQQFEKMVNPPYNNSNEKKDEKEGGDDNEEGDEEMAMNDETKKTTRPKRSASKSSRGGSKKK